MKKNKSRVFCLAVLAIMAGGVTSWATTLTVTSGLKLRLESINVDGSNNSTLTNGALVQTWKDLSGNNNDHTQATAGSQPTFRTGAWGPQGRPALDFNGGKRLAKTAMSYSGFTGVSVFAVARRNAKGFYSRLADVTGDEWRLCQNGADDTAWEFTVNGTVTKLYNVYTSGENALLSGTYTCGTTQSSILRMTKTTEYSYATPVRYAATGTVTLASFTDPRDSHVGDTDSSASNTIAAVLIYGRALDTGEVAAVEQYLWDVYLSDETLAAAPKRGTAPLTVSFDASGFLPSPPGASIVSYAWNFGDGVSKNGGSSRTHTYARAGTYTASVRVTDDTSRTNTIYSAPIVVPPVDDASLALWLDGSNIDRQRNEKLTNSQPAAAWLDLSGNGNDHTQTTAGNRPVMSKGLMGPQARDVLQFNAKKLSKSVNYAGFTGISVFAVVRRNVAAFYSNLFGIGTGANGWQLRQYSSVAGSWEFLLNGSTSTRLESGYTEGEYVLLSATHNYGTLQPATLRMTRTNEVVSTVTQNATCASPGTATSDLVGTSFNHDIAEALVYGRALNSNEVAAVETYVIQKYFRVAPPPPVPAGTVISIR